MPLPEQLSCFAITTPGIESLLDTELKALGIAPVDAEAGGVHFMATRRQLADSLTWLRTANRVTVRLASFHARSFAELERHANKVPWADVLAARGTVHFRVTSKKSKLYHEDGIAERLEKAALAARPGITGVRAAGVAAEMDEEDVRNGSPVRVQRFIVRVMRDEVTLSADAAGPLMYLRGYRQAVAKAPLRETLAAALLMASGWAPDQPLLDPMCGSGTIAIEAAMIARRIAPGLARSFAAAGWPGFGNAFSAAADAARDAQLEHSPVMISGCDRDAGAIEAASANAVRAGVSADVSFAVAPVSAMTPDAGTGMIVTNPPYGARIGERERLRDLYAALGRTIAERRPQWRLAMLSADRMLERQVGMRLREVAATSNGGIPVRVIVGQGPGARA